MSIISGTLIEIWKIYKRNIEAFEEFTDHQAIIEAIGKELTPYVIFMGDNAFPVGYDEIEIVQKAVQQLRG